MENRSSLIKPLGHRRAVTSDRGNEGTMEVSRDIHDIENEKEERGSNDKRQTYPE
jgi:hypothetical protein